MKDVSLLLVSESCNHRNQYTLSSRYVGTGLERSHFHRFEGSHFAAVDVFRKHHHPTARQPSRRIRLTVQLIRPCVRSSRAVDTS